MSSHCVGFSCGAPGLQLTLNSMANGLNCPTACGILQDQGLNSRPLHQQVDSQPLDHQGSPGPTLHAEDTTGPGLLRAWRPGCQHPASSHDRQFSSPAEGNSPQPLCLLSRAVNELLPGYFHLALVLSKY